MQLGLCLIAGLTALVAISPAQAVEALAGGGADRWIEVTGEGSVSAAPDFARVTLGVATTGKTAGEAMGANAKAANALVSLIKSEGIAPADIQTSEVSISPMFSRPSQ
ncbi:MAG TPA: SIMPL domain-containing protein, partial [Roseiarcus sp.]|nr:SIMPL domain-containing protein [Roseiarcus sp.]